MSMSVSRLRVVGGGGGLGTAGRSNPVFHLLVSKIVISRMGFEDGKQRGKDYHDRCVCDV